MEKWDLGPQREGRDERRHHPLRLRRNEKLTAKKHVASGAHPGVVRCLSALVFGIRSKVIRAGQR